MERRLEVLAELGKLLLCTGNRETAVVFLGMARQVMRQSAPDLDLEVVRKLLHHLAVARGQVGPPADWELTDEPVDDGLLIRQTSSVAHRELLESEVSP
jgi:hypothetical protein